MTDDTDPAIREKLLDRLRDRGLNQQDAADIFDRSRAWASQELFRTPGRTLRRMMVNAPANLNKFAERMGYASGPDMLDALNVFPFEGEGAFPRENSPDVAMGYQGLPAANGENVVIRALGTIQAGAPTLQNPSAGEMDGLFEVPRFFIGSYAPEEIYALRVVGDSMASDEVRAQIREGTYVLVNPNLEPEPGDVVVVWLKDSNAGVLKEYWPTPRTVILRSWNAEHAPIVLDEDTPAIIQGVVIGWPTIRRTNGRRKG